MKDALYSQKGLKLSRMFRKMQNPTPDSKHQPQIHLEIWGNQDDPGMPRTRSPVSLTILMNLQKLSKENSSQLPIAQVLIEEQPKHTCFSFQVLVSHVVAEVEVIHTNSEDSGSREDAAIQDQNDSKFLHNDPGNDDVMATTINQTIESTCTGPRRHFMFSKIEKTGSSTLYGIFQRFVKTNKLNLMVQTEGYHMRTSQPKGAHPG